MDATFVADQSGGRDDRIRHQEELVAEAKNQLEALQKEYGQNLEERQKEWDATYGATMEHYRALLSQQRTAHDNFEREQSSLDERIRIAYHDFLSYLGLHFGEITL